MEPNVSQSMQNASALQLDGPPPFSYIALCSNAGFSSDGNAATALYTNTEPTLSTIPSANSNITFGDLLSPATAADATHRTSQSIVVVASGSGASFTRGSSNATFSSTSSSQPMFFSNMVGGPGTIITFHTLPFVDGTSGQDLTVVADDPLSHAPASTTATVDLSSPENAALLQSLLSQGVTLKAEDASMLTSDKSNTVHMGQLIDFVPAPVPSGHIGQVSSQPSQPASTSDLSLDARVLLTAGGDCKAASSLVVPNSSDTEAVAGFDFTDETPIFTRVCATLNADILHSVVGSKDFALDQLWGDENVRLGIDVQQSITLEASLPTLARIHNKLKDLLHIFNPTLLQLQRATESSLSSGTGTKAGAFSTQSSRPATVASIAAKERKKVEEKEAASRPLQPLVSSRGRIIKVPSHLASGIVNNHDVFGSDDSEEDVKPPVLLPQRRRRGRPRKETMFAAVASNSYAVVKNENIYPQDGLDSDERDVVKNENISPQDGLDSDERDIAPLSSGDVNVKKNTESIPDLLHRPGVLRKARNIIHVTQATQMRRVYEGRIKFKFFCNQCSFKSKRESHFTKHTKLHETGQMEVHCCRECDFKTIRLSHLRRHELLHKSTLLKCNICGYMTDTSQMLLKHTKLKHPNGQLSTKPQHLFRCEVCGHSSSNQYYFTHHLMRHAHDSNQPAIAGGPGGFQCPQCQRTFQRRVHLERHLRDVHGPQHRPHLCDICGKSFKRSDALQQHKYVHTAQGTRNYPFHCSKCSKGFRSQAHLKEHQTRHSSERPYLCQYCGASFKTPSVQRKHIMSLHIRPGAHCCLLCNKQFNTSYALTRHARIHKVVEQKLEAAAGDLVTDGMTGTDGDQQVSTMTLAMEDDSVTAHSQQVNVDGSIVSVTDADDAHTGLVTDVLATGIEEALGEAESTLRTQYIVQGNETATALFYLTGNL